ncbi:tRNA-dihydrouridine synthase [Bacteroidia bacterium]|nr:tRNA-dihydrouridine synthase [Bacteroidia bacterium]
MLFDTDFPVWLSPMEDVTNPPFRRLCKRMGADVVVTEFVPTDAVIRNVAHSLKKFDFDESERPLGIQIYGHLEDAMVEGARLAAAAKPDFIDINWGCPVKKIAGRGAGSGIFKDIPKMLRITEQIVKAVDVPVTVKTRLGWDEQSKVIVEVAERLQDVGINALSIHGRTRAQLYTGEADWTLIGEVKNNPYMYIPIYGNGDIKTPERVAEVKQRYNVDGVLVGRASIGNPWIFREIKHYLQTGDKLPSPTHQERLDICRQHLLDVIEWKGLKKGISQMRQHYSNYFHSIPYFKPLRIELLRATELDHILEIFDRIADFLESSDPASILSHSSD